ncbi:unnamed protein product, partial [Mesorhabditis belari]|uniref:Uncharacterized protein n=1 Tax=Mesorhabditis belari TaxID=2138241 RepID=A0AAF3FM68_9BILA
MQTCSENDTPRCEILSYQTIPSPAGWGVAGTTDAGLARIICPLRFLHMSQGRSRRPYPIYHNELMEKVHDYDRRTIGFSEKLDVELLKRLKVKAEVIRTRVPEWRGRNGLLLKVLLEKEIVDLDDDWLQQGRIVEELESERNSVPNESNDRFPTKSQKQELRGIVMNQAKGMNFIFLSNGMEASYSMLDATRNNAPMKLGDHLECVISDVLTFDDVKKRTKCEILSYRIVPTPTGWGFEGQTPAGLAKVEEPDVPIRRREEPKSTPIQKKEPCREYQTKGFVIKRWGLFLIVCLENKRSAIIDTRNFPDGVPELGTFIECDVKMLNASILDQEMIYEWEVVNMGPIDRSDYESIVEKDTAYVFSRHLMFEGYLSVGKTRQAHFSHPFFGSICDKYDIIYSSSQPGDPIEAYIGAVRDGESKFQWIITDPKANVNSPQKPLPRAVIPHFAEEYESENNLPTTSETYSVHDAQSKISYGTSDETKRINSRVTDRSTSKPVDQGRALTCEDLVTKAMNNPEIRDVIFRADPD